MKEEILRAKGRLVGLESQKEDLELRIKGLIILARNYIDPYEPDIARLRTKEALKVATDLDLAKSEFLTVSAQIAEIKDALK